MSDARAPHELLLRPIGYAKTPFREKADAPRQPLAARDVPGTIEVDPTYRDGLSDLEGFDRLFLVFGFDRAPATKSLKVQPPRSEKKRGVFATRSPHRPNGLGLSVVRLVRVEGCTLHILDVDLLDGTPIYDIKPYLAYTDAFPDARAGWLEESPGASSGTSSTPSDPRASYEVVFRPEAHEACRYVEERTGLSLERRIRDHLSLGPEPHAYRRIRHENGQSVLSVKAWRIAFESTGERRIEVTAIRSGYSDRDFAKARPGDADVEAHADFVARFSKPARLVT